MNRLARLSAAERRRIMEEFVEEMFHGLDLVDPDIRERMRNTAVNLPDDPTPEQVDAWVELAEMVQDPEFRAQMRKAAEFNHADRGPETPAGASMWFAKLLVELVGRAREKGVAPESPEADKVLRKLLGNADRAAVLERITASHNVRIARWRELLGILKDQPVRAFEEEFGWVVAALQAHPGR